MAQEHKVDVLFRVIPNYCRDGKLGLSLVLTPDTRNPGGRAISLSEWPSRISDAIRNASLVVSGRPGIQISALIPNWYARANTGSAMNIWSAIFGAGCCETPLFDALYNVLKDQQSRAPGAPRKTARGAVVNSQHTLSFPASYLLNLFDGIYAKQTAYSMAHALSFAQGISTSDLNFLSTFFMVGTDVSSDGAVHGWPLLRSLGERWLSVRSRAAASGDLIAGGRAASIPYKPLLRKILADLAGIDLKATPHADLSATFDARFVSVLDKSLDGLSSALGNGGIAAAQLPLTSGNLFTALKLSSDDRTVANSHGDSCILVDLSVQNHVSESLASPDRLDNPLLAIALHRAANRSDPDPTPPLSCADIARRRFFGLMAQPTLASILGFIFDIEIKLADLEAEIGSLPVLGTGTLSVAVPGMTGAQNLEVAYKLDKTRRFFGPCPRDEYGNPNAVALNGLLDISWNSQTIPRYSLGSPDLDSLVAGNENAVNSRYAAHAKGQMQNKLSATLAPARTGGIALYDQLHVNDVVRQLDSQPGGPLYAEDLTSGYRVDICRDPSSTWTTATGRSMQFPDIDDSLLPNADIRFLRDQGFVRALDRVQSSNDTGTEAHVLPREFLFCWTGENLATSTPYEGPSDTGEADPNTPLSSDSVMSEYGTDIDIGLSPSLRCHPLRIGSKYWVGLRRVYINGASISLEDAQRNYYDKQMGILGSSQKATDPYSFLRRDPIPAPVVHLGENDPLIDPGTSRSRPGDQLDVLLLRDVGTGASAKRYIVPARATFELCEMHGCFDTSDEDVPAGAFGYLDLSEAEGTFPIAINGGITHPNPKLNGDSNAMHTPVGTVLRLRSGDMQPRAPYYPDPFAQLCCAALHRDRQRLCAASSAVAGSFYRTDNWPNASPVLLELRARTAEDDDAEPALSLEDGKIESGDGPKCAKIVVTAPHGTRTTLRLWSVPSKAKDFRNIQFTSWASDTIETLSSVSRMISGRLARQMTDLASTSLNWPIHNMSGFRDVEIVHAVRKPNKPPSIISIDAVRISQKASTNSSPIAQEDKAWKLFVDNTLPPLGSEPDGAITYFTGSVGFHRSSTMKLRAIARWLDVSDDAAVVRDASGTYQYRPNKIENEELFSISNIPYDLRGRRGAIDLLTNEEGQLRNLSYSFKDKMAATAAREITVKMAATSRYTGYFPKSSEPGHFDRESSETSFWIKNTAQPESVAVDRIIPLFSWSEETDARGPGAIVTRKTKLRVFLKSKFHTSGGDERVALVFATDPTSSPTIGKDPAACCWASDPARLTDQLPGFMPADVVRNADTDISPVTLHMPVPPSGELMPGRDTVQVITRAFTPMLDPVEGLWRFDVDIDVGSPAHIGSGSEPSVDEGVAWPFVRLALCRYQPHSIEHKELSPPIFEWVQIAPWRRVKVSISDYKKVNVLVRGPTQSAMLGAGKEGELSIKAAPFFEVSLVRRIDRSHWLPVPGQDGRPIIGILTTGDPVMGAGRFIGNWSSLHALKWFDLPKRWYLDDFGLIVKEFESAVQDNCDIGPATEGMSADAGTVVKHGPLFMCLIPLSEGDWEVRGGDL